MRGFPLRKAATGLALGLAVAAWAGFSALAFDRLMEYKSRPGEPEVAANWPASSSFARPAGGPTMLVFLHPRCPCASATLGELERLLARAPALTDVRIVLLAPGGDPDAWNDEAAPRRTERPGVTRVLDPGGALARAFGARTSGAVRLFGPDGALWFAGGITPGRGHEGDNDGTRAILNSLRASGPSPIATPVFGCGLSSRVAACNEEATCTQPR